MQLESLGEGWRVLESVSAILLEDSDACCSLRSTTQKVNSGGFWASGGLKVGIHLGKEKEPLCSMELIYAYTTVYVMKLLEGGTT